MRINLEDKKAFEFVHYFNFINDFANSSFMFMFDPSKRKYIVSNSDEVYDLDELENNHMEELQKVMSYDLFEFVNLMFKMSHKYYDSNNLYLLGYSNDNGLISETIYHNYELEDIIENDFDPNFYEEYITKTSSL